MFKVGELVFAKMRLCEPWPAKVLHATKKNVIVLFYGVEPKHQFSKAIPIRNIRKFKDYKTTLGKMMSKGYLKNENLLTGLNDIFEASLLQIKVANLVKPKSDSIINWKKFEEKWMPLICDVYNGRIDPKLILRTHLSEENLIYIRRVKEKRMKEKTVAYLYKKYEDDLRSLLNLYGYDANYVMKLYNDIIQRTLLKLSIIHSKIHTRRMATRAANNVINCVNQHIAMINNYLKKIYIGFKEMGVTKMSFPVFKTKVMHAIRQSPRET